MAIIQKKILFLGNSYLTVFGFRREIIERFINDGYEVFVSFPNGPFGEGESASAECGCKFIETHIDRRGTNIAKDVILIIEYYKLLLNVKPDIVLTFTVKPDIYAGITCSILKIPYISNITGLGKGLTGRKLTQIITIFLYKLAVKKARCVFFQNTSDERFFCEKHIICPKTKVLPGSGVNLEKYIPLEYPTSEKIKFIYIARVMREKGIEEYFFAAHTLKREFSDVEFHICGYCEEDYKTKLEEGVRSGEIIYHGLVTDVIPYEKMCHCVVLPSYHPEGVSNVLLEAAACARPIITTNRPGCRETVENNITGYLIEERNASDLVEKMRQFILLPEEKKKEMGRLGRIKIEKEFDRKKVVESYRYEVLTVDETHKR
ncbi:MAG: glycosyltransferase family 4 protein [Lachnospiraceae bacterium]|nr:glycosyltransferase family 4 protein [Lachnospiraceae bacterium]